MKRLLFIAVLFIALAACKDKDANSVKFPPPAYKADAEVREKVLPPPPNADANASGPVGNADDATSEDNANANQNSTVADTSKKIVKDATIVFETNDLLATRAKILDSLKKYGGYADEDNQTTNSDSNRVEYELKVHIPSKYFDLMLNTASSAADKIDSKSITITDSTTHFIDITTRLNNKKLLEKHYQELLGKATKISDLLEIENKLNEIRSDIESTQGQLNYLNKQVAYSSLDITFYARHNARVNSTAGFGYKIKKALGHGWRRLQNLFFGFIGLWPYIILLLLACWLVKKWLKRRKARRTLLDQ